MSILKDYLTYAKKYIHPKISESAGQTLIESYVNMRKMGSGRGQISAYPRQLESLIRLSEAHARMRLSEIVEVADVEEAKRLYAWVNYTLLIIIIISNIITSNGYCPNPLFFKYM